VVNGVLYVGPGDGNTYALNATTGHELWQVLTGSADSLAVANGMVYVGSGDGNVYAIEASTGFPLWQFSTGSAVFSSPAVVNGAVCVGSLDGNLYGFTLAAGIRAPRRPGPGSLHPDLSLRAKR
jgi:outer membrane protein assembly factor BamB